MIRLPLIFLTFAVYVYSGAWASDHEKVCESEAIEQLRQQLATQRAALPQATYQAVAFEEERTFPFRSQARNLSGRLLRDLESGRFAFDYEKPRQLKLIYKDGVVWLLHGSREPEQIPEATVSLALFAALFQGDMEALAEDWTIRTGYSEEAISFLLIPKSPRAKSAYRRVELIFSENALRHVVVIRDNAVEHRYTFNLPHPMDRQEFETIFE